MCTCLCRTLPSLPKYACWLSCRCRSVAWHGSRSAIMAMPLPGFYVHAMTWAFAVLPSRCSTCCWRASNSKAIRAQVCAFACVHERRVRVLCERRRLSHMCCAGTAPVAAGVVDAALAAVPSELVLVDYPSLLFLSRYVRRWLWCARCVRVVWLRCCHRCMTQLCDLHVPGCWLACSQRQWMLVLQDIQAASPSAHAFLRREAARRLCVMLCDNAPHASSHVGTPQQGPLAAFVPPMCVAPIFFCFFCGRLACFFARTRVVCVRVRACVCDCLWARPQAHVCWRLCWGVHSRCVLRCAAGPSCPCSTKLHGTSCLGVNPAASRPRKRTSW